MRDLGCAHKDATIKWQKGRICSVCLQMHLKAIEDGLDASEGWRYRLNKWYYHHVRMPFFYATKIRLPWFAIAVIVALSLCSCSSEEVIDPISLPSGDKISAEYAHPSDSAPESLKPFYDPGLTEALNR